jgi:hypothetical protein
MINHRFSAGKGSAIHAFALSRPVKTPIRFVGFFLLRIHRQHAFWTLLTGLSL